MSYIHFPRWIWIYSKDCVVIFRSISWTTIVSNINNMLTTNQTRNNQCCYTISKVNSTSVNSININCNISNSISSNQYPYSSIFTIGNVVNFYIDCKVISWTYFKCNVGCICIKVIITRECYGSIISSGRQVLNIETSNSIPNNCNINIFTNT